MNNAPAWTRRFLLLTFIVGIGASCASAQHAGSHPETSYAADFLLEDSTGTSYALSENLQQGPVVVLFYRGHW